MDRSVQGLRSSLYRISASTWGGVLSLSMLVACGSSEGTTTEAAVGGGTADDGALGGYGATNLSAGGALAGISGVGGTGTGGHLAGGAGAGGAATGGVGPASGGAAAGGAGVGGVGVGGVGVGGVGPGVGGAAATGGVATGGVASGSGGVGVGGAAVGGASTGGVGVGGTGAGGSAAGGAGAGGSAAGDTGAGGSAAGDTGAGGSAAGGVGTGGATGSDVCSVASGLEAEYPGCFPLQLRSGIDDTRTDAAIFVTTADILATHPDFNPNAFVVLDGGTELASQAVDNDPDGTADELVFTVDLAPNQTTTLAVRYATSGTKLRTYAQRAQALVSPKTGGSWNGDTYVGGAYTDVDFLDLTGHIDHGADYIRFEGPGWESDRIGHRVYMDDRNGIDIFGKKQPGMILQDIDYTNEDYTTMSNWGMDILHNGDAMGVGSVGTWANGAPVKLSNLQTLSARILASGPVYALLRMSYGGWQTASGTYNVTADISITAGSRVTRKIVTIDGNIDNLCAGMPKHAQAAVMPPPSTAGWTYLATYGSQSLVPDGLGLAVLYRTSDKLQLVEDGVNQLVTLAPTEGSLTYYFLGAWAGEVGGIADQQQFSSFLEATLKELDSPVEVTVL